MDGVTFCWDRQMKKTDGRWSLVMTYNDMVYQSEYISQKWDDVRQRYTKITKHHNKKKTRLTTYLLSRYLIFLLVYGWITLIDCPGPWPLQLCSNLFTYLMIAIICQQKILCNKAQNTLCRFVSYIVQAIALSRNISASTRNCRIFCTWLEQ